MLTPVMTPIKKLWKTCEKLWISLWNKSGKHNRIAETSKKCYHLIMKDVILAIIAIIPTCATAASTFYLKREQLKIKNEQNKNAARAEAKSSIQNMITQDILRAEVLGKMPENLTDIEDEYTVYHANGGNGKITRQVNEYKVWYAQFKPSKDNPKKVDGHRRALPENVCLMVDKDTARQIQQIMDKKRK